MNPLVAQRLLAQLEDVIAVGKTFARAEDVQAAVIAVFLKRGEGDLVRKYKMDRSRVYVGCLREGCAFIVRAKPNKEGVWVVTSSPTAHLRSGGAGAQAQPLVLHFGAHGARGEGAVSRAR